MAAKAVHIPKALKPFCIPIDAVKPFPRNNKNHTDIDIDLIAKSLSRYGARQFICVVDKKNVVIAGHGRLLAARKLGMKEIPVLKHPDMTDAEARGFRIADNKSADNAEYSWDAFCAEVLDLNDLNFDMAALGMGEAELQQIAEWTGKSKGGGSGEAGGKEPATITCPNCGAEFTQ